MRKEEKIAVTFFGYLLTSSFIVICLGVIQTYFLYKHVQAPSVVWILWIIQIPISIVMNFVSKMLKDLDLDK